MKEGARDYLREDMLKETAKRYSQFIYFLVYDKGKKDVYAEAADIDENDDKEDKRRRMLLRPRMTWTKRKDAEEVQKPKKMTVSEREG